jgi:integrase
MRPGEVCELRPENIDRSSTPWLYRPPSGGKTFHLEHSRKVWIGPVGRGILLFWLDQAEAGQPLFRLRKRRGEGFVAVSVNYYRDCIASACRLAGVQVFRPNQIRHAYATEIHRRYEDDEAVAAALGNSPEVARQVYVDGPADAVARRIAEELG